jgi:hypothetical protein
MAGIMKDSKLVLDLWRQKQLHRQPIVCERLK